jgi:hypothetical protein
MLEVKGFTPTRDDNSSKTDLPGVSKDQLGKLVMLLHESLDQAVGKAQSCQEMLARQIWGGFGMDNYHTVKSLNNPTEFELKTRGHEALATVFANVDTPPVQLSQEMEHTTKGDEHSYVFGYTISNKFESKVQPVTVTHELKWAVSHHWVDHQGYLDADQEGIPAGSSTVFTGSEQSEKRTGSVLSAQKTEYSGVYPSTAQTSEQ